MRKNIYISKGFLNYGGIFYTFRNTKDYFMNLSIRKVDTLIANTLMSIKYENLI